MEKRMGYTKLNAKYREDTQDSCMIDLVILSDKRDGCIQGTTSLLFGRRMIQQTAQYQFFVATPDV